MNKSVAEGPFLILLLSLLCCNSLFAQRSFAQFSNLTTGFDFEVGASMPSYKSTKDVFAVGLNASAGFKVAALNSQKLWIKPVGGVKWYFKEIKKENSITDHFRNIKAGLELQYNLLESNQLVFSPVLRIDHNWCANYFSATYYRDMNFNYATVEKSEKFFKGTGISTDVGLRIQKADWYLKIDYELFKPKLNLNQTLVEEAFNEGFNVAPTHKFNFNSINIGFGCDLIFKK